MLAYSIALFCFGLCLSSVFSGSETAFYRIPKLRLKLDAMEGDPKAERIIWLVNHPGLFVATVLVGNNIANYAVSLATVLFVGATIGTGTTVEIISTLVLAPVLFVYGEMFPKYLCLHAPNRMLRLLSPVIMFFFRLLLPITALLWLVNQFIAKILGQGNEMLQLTLGRQELAGVLDEGRETGILVGAQRRLADGVFEVSHRTVRDWTIPRNEWPLITTDMKPRQVIEIARKHDLAELPVFETGVFDATESRSGLRQPVGDLPVGFVRVIDLEMAVRNRLDETSLQLLQLLQTELPIRSTVEVSDRHTLLTAMILLQTLHGSFGCVLDEHRQCIGFVRSDQLRDIILNSPYRERAFGRRP